MIFPIGDLAPVDRLGPAVCPRCHKPASHFRRAVRSPAELAERRAVELVCVLCWAEANLAAGGLEVAK